ncbi:nucleotidyltransferase domain-containing protein [Candidatus Pacearchaeota archaeon]|nr:nucleotidyltransferase domain-containing protein [Candidatus Pacearchaeota archaeon]
MVSQNELIAYAMNFASYLISKLDSIDRIILHGSVARGDFDEDSDIDIFIDANNKFEERINKIIKNYYNTINYKEFELKGIKNEISTIIGKLDNQEWKSLKRAIVNTGVILYGKYKAEVEKIHQYVLISFENIKPEKKRVSTFRKLFGFKIGNKSYAGMTEEINGKRIGKGSLMVPIEKANIIIKYLKEKKVAFVIYDIWTDSKV